MEPPARHHEQVFFFFLTWPSSGICLIVHVGSLIPARYMLCSTSRKSYPTFFYILLAHGDDSWILLFLAFPQNPVPHCWSEQGHYKRKFCNVCRKRLDESLSMRCEGEYIRECGATVKWTS
jgi:hypothetical protein